MQDIRPDKSEEINQMIQKYSDELSEDQLRALPMLAFGMTASRVAKLVNVSPTTIRNWKATDQTFRRALQEFAGKANIYHLAMLNQAASIAWDRVFEILQDEYDVEDKVGRNNQANMAKFIIGELDVMNSQDEPEESETELELHVSEKSVDLIAKRVQELNDGKDDTEIETEYEVEQEQDDDPRTMHNSMSAAEALDGENFDAEIKEINNPEATIYPKHPLTEYGKIDTKEDGHYFRCHMCGNWYVDLVVHMRTGHNMSPVRYRKIFKIPDNIPLGRVAPIEPVQEEIDVYNDYVERYEAREDAEQQK